MTKLQQCYDCDEYKKDVDWCEILTTEDDGFSLQLCEPCMEKRCDGNLDDLIW
jgi:hypothetical protein